MNHFLYLRRATVSWLGIGILSNNVILLISIVILLIPHSGDQLLSSFFALPSSLIGLSLVTLHPGHQLRDRLREIHLDPSIIDCDIVHLQVSLFAGLGALELDEAVLQGLACLPISDHFDALYRSEAGEDELEVSLLGNRIELADEKDILGRLDAGIRKLTDHLQCHCLLLSLLFPRRIDDILLSGVLL